MIAVTADCIVLAGAWSAVAPSYPQIMILHCSLRLSGLHISLSVLQPRFSVMRDPPPALLLKIVDQASERTIA